MAEVKAVPIKRDNKLCAKAMLGEKNRNTRVVRQDVLVQDCEPLFKWIFTGWNFQKGSKRALEDTTGYDEALGSYGNNDVIP